MCDYCQFFKSIHFDINTLKDFNKIYVLISGGFDSTLLADFVHAHYPTKTYFVNCWNPYEQSPTLQEFQGRANFIQVKPKGEFNYGAVLKQSFLNIPKALALKRKGKYHKKVFPCCYYIKHKAFFKDPMFLEPNTVVVSGIKFGDGQKRALYMNKLRNEGKKFEKDFGKKCDKVGFLHQHHKGQMFIYPYRDYTRRELPKDIKKRLTDSHPGIKHSGCSICPVLVVWGLRNEKSRYWKSMDYWNKLNGQRQLNYLGRLL